MGKELARRERELGILEPDSDTVIVPVPDTAKAAADAMAYALGIPSLEGLMRNRYVGRTFIEGQNRAERVQLKYTPLREVLEGKKVLLVEDTVVRSTTLKTLLNDLRARGGAKCAGRLPTYYCALFLWYRHVHGERTFRSAFHEKSCSNH